jgi:hypothetical protein
MGGGGFGTNASMHWKVFYDDAEPDKPSVGGRDPIAPDKIGRGNTQTKDFPGFLRVKLRFKGTNAMAQLSALRTAAAATPTNTDDFIITALVPAIPRDDPDDDQPFEVMVDW